MKYRLCYGIACLLSMKSPWPSLRLPDQVHGIGVGASGFSLGNSVLVNASAEWCPTITFST